MKRSDKFNKQVIVVTGASSGIGRAIALAFARQGGRVVLVARTVAKLEEVAKTIRTEGGEALVVATNVASQDQVGQLANTVFVKYGQTDILVNNAGTSTVGPVTNPAFVEDSQQMMAVDYFGAVHCTQAFLPQMQRQGRGYIVNMSSVVGLKAFPNFAAYSACMHAIAGFSDALRQELHGSGIHVSTIHPALTQTPLLQHVNTDAMPAPFRHMTPLMPETVAKAVIHAVNKKRNRVVIPWQPKAMLVLDALSSRYGDWMVRMLPKSWFIGLLGMNRGRHYQHEQLTS